MARPIGLGERRGPMSMYDPSSTIFTTPRPLYGQTGVTEEGLLKGKDLDANSRGAEKEIAARSSPKAVVSKVVTALVPTVMMPAASIMPVRIMPNSITPNRKVNYRPLTLSILGVGSPVAVMVMKYSGRLLGEIAVGAAASGGFEKLGRHLDRRFTMRVRTGQGEGVGKYVFVRGKSGKSADSPEESVPDEGGFWNPLDLWGLLDSWLWS